MAGFRRPHNKRIHLRNLGKEACASSKALRPRFAGHSPNVGPAQEGDVMSEERRQPSLCSATIHSAVEPPPTAVGTGTWREPRRVV